MSGRFLTGPEEGVKEKMTRNAYPRVARRLGAAFAVIMGASAAVMPTAARADLTFGGDARNFAMGGAGIALQRSGGSNRFNPATLMTEEGKFSLYTPSLGTRAEGGLSMTDVIDFMTEANGNEQMALEFARKFADEESSFGINGNVGLRVGPVEFIVGGVGRTRILPSEDLQRFAESGRPFSQINSATEPGDYSADIISAGYYTLPSIGVGFRAPIKPVGFTVDGGVRVKLMNAVYSHYRADEAAIRSGAVSNLNDLRAPEMGNEDILTKSGVGVDLGFLARHEAGWNAALVVNNLIKPNLKFTNVTPAGNPNDRTELELLATTISVGGAFQKGSTLFAVDLVDITGAVQAVQLRAGAEQRLGRILALRAGYSSGSGITYGLGLFGFDIAFSQDQPLEVVRTLKF